MALNIDFTPIDTSINSKKSQYFNNYLPIIYIFQLLSYSHIISLLNRKCFKQKKMSFILSKCDNKVILFSFRWKTSNTCLLIVTILNILWLIFLNIFLRYYAKIRYFWFFFQIKIYCDRHDQNKLPRERGSKFFRQGGKLRIFWRKKFGKRKAAKKRKPLGRRKIREKGKPDSPRSI